MLIIDAHLDLSWNALQWNRDLLLPVHAIRTMESRLTDKGRALGTVSLPALRRGRIALSFATLLARCTGHPEHHIDYPSPIQSYAVAHGQLTYYRGLEREGHLRVITDLEQLDAHIAEWQAWDAQPEADPETSPPPGVVVSMEGADPILRPDTLEEWWEAGLRLLGPTHYGPGRYAGGTGTELGLTQLGTDLLSEVERTGVLLDLTHCSDRSFREALDAYGGPVLASHNNCRALVPHQRQFTDEQLKAIIDRDGVIGVAFDNWMLSPGWIIGEGDPADVSLHDVVDQMDHICQLAGNAEHVAIGTDLDGGFGLEQSPGDLDTIADLQNLVSLLSERGYKEEDIARVLHANWLRFLRRSWGEAKKRA